ncbi:MAG: WD40 repeat domain-containing protein [Adhaeribacter sp.]
MASPLQVSKIATLTGHRDCVYTLERSAQDQVFYSAGGDGLVVAWDLDQPGQGVLLAQVPSSVYALHHLPASNLLLVGQNQQGLQVIDVAARQVQQSVALPGMAFFDIQSSAQLGQVYAAGGDGTLFILDSASFQVKQALRYSAKSLRCLALLEARNEIALGYSDHVIRILDATTGQLKQEIRGHANSVFTLAYSPDGRYLLSGSRDAHLKVWEVAQDYREAASIVAHMFTINHLTYSPDGRYFASCSMDKSIKVWDAASFRLLKVIDKARHAGHATSVNKLFWSARLNSLVSCSDDRTISVWDLNFSLRYEDNTIRNQAEDL